MKKLIIKGMGIRYFSDKIVEWYLENRRPLPWRDTSDPYKIWLSEIILQQTRVAQGLPYYRRFVDEYPTIHDLAAADEQRVLRTWQGLGYYTRARNLHKCARYLVEKCEGRFPESSHALRQLPGIGSYTAAAIASFAFGEKIAVLDGNVVRILSRIFGIAIPASSGQGKKAFESLANELIPSENPAIHNQAAMEFGALWCTPVSPKCIECPFNKSCVARNQGLVDSLPVKAVTKASRKRFFLYFVVEQENSYLMKKRTGRDIWNGLYDFVLVEKPQFTRSEKALKQEALRLFHKAEVIRVSKDYKHVLSHQTIHCRFIHLTTPAPVSLVGESAAFYSRGEIAQLPKPALITRFLAEQDAH